LAIDSDLFIISPYNVIARLLRNICRSDLDNKYWLLI
jgi:hypothetical protein